MSYETPAPRREALNEVVERMRGARCPVLTTHVNADGDGAGSEAALAAWFRALGTDPFIVNPTPFPELYTFLLDDGQEVLDAATREAARACEAADLAVVLDTGEASRIGRVRSMIEGLDVAVIDHHPPGEDSLAGVAVRDPSACATGELIYDVVRATDGPWSRPIVEGIYVAILTDTGSFRFSNATPDAHRVAAELIEKGADPEELHRRVYGASPLRALRLLEASLHTLEVDEDGGVAWMRVPRSAYDQLDAGHADLEGLVDYPRSVEGVEVGVLFRQTAAGDTKVSFRSTGEVDVNRLARRYGGGGHTKAAGALVSRPIDEVIPEVVEETRKAVVAMRTAEEGEEEA